MPRKRQLKKEPRKGGQSATHFTEEQFDFCSEWIGRVQYASRVTDKIKEKYGLSHDLAVELLKATRVRVFAEMRSRGEEDPLTGVFLFLRAIVADESKDTSHRLNAANQLIRLFGMERLTELLKDAGDVETFIAQVYERRRAAAAAAQAKQTLDDGGDE